MFVKLICSQKCLLVPGLNRVSVFHCLESLTDHQKIKSSISARAYETRVWGFGLNERSFIVCHNVCQAYTYIRIMNNIHNNFSGYPPEFFSSGNFILYKLIIKGYLLQCTTLTFVRVRCFDLRLQNVLRNPSS